MLFHRLYVHDWSLNASVYDLPLYVTVYPSAPDEYVAVFRSSHPDGWALPAPPCANLLKVSVAVTVTL